MLRLYNSAFNFLRGKNVPLPCTCQKANIIFEEILYSMGLEARIKNHLDSLNEHIRQEIAAKAIREEFNRDIPFLAEKVAKKIPLSAQANLF